MSDGIHKTVFNGTAVLALLALACLAYSRPAYFTSQTNLTRLLFLEVLIGAVWMYRRVYFPLVIVTFLLAGMNLPVGSVWTTIRWVVLGLGALIGPVIMLRDRRYPLRRIHLLALFTILAALVSAEFARYASVSFLKVLGLLTLFVYAGTGARLAMLGREVRFFSGLLTASEIAVGAIASFYGAGIEVMGNRNSLGAAMGVVAAPILLWGTFMSENRFIRRRRAAMFVICASLIVVSNARAAMAAALVSCGVLCLTLRRTKLLMQGMVIVVIVSSAFAILRPEAYSSTASSWTERIIFKGKDDNRALLASRQFPWQQAFDAIAKHPWFGSGFGTFDNGEDATEHQGEFSTTTAVSTEHGSSYLAVVVWVGLVGSLPFLVLLLALAKKIFQTAVWMWRTGNPAHPAIPLAMVMLAGLVHAGLEDWLFAPGYYVTVLFWSMAFVCADYVPSLTNAASSVAVGGCG